VEGSDEQLRNNFNTDGNIAHESNQNLVMESNTTDQKEQQQPVDKFEL